MARLIERGKEGATIFYFSSAEGGFGSSRRQVRAQLDRFQNLENLPCFSCIAQFTYETGLSGQPGQPGKEQKMPGTIRLRSGQQKDYLHRRRAAGAPC